MNRPAVFLDRDGTIVEEVGFITRASQLVLLPSAGQAIRTLNAHGFAVVVATNQSGIARGLFDERALDAMHRHLDRLLAAEQAVVDAYYHCPHHPEAVVERYRVECGCRKPSAGMLLQARDDLGLDLERSWMIGDRWRDVAAGTLAGARGILVRTGYGSADAAAPPADARADAILDHLMEAVDWILRSSPSSPR